VTRRGNDGRTDLWKAAIHRRADAWALLGSGPGHARGATYLGGYAIECRLKAVAMEIYGSRTLRGLAERLKVGEDEVYTHGLEALLNHMPQTLRENLRSTDEVWRAFTAVNRWRPSWRYEPHPFDARDAKDFLKAVDAVFHWLDRNRA
jgi:hypothetical protein